MGARKNFTGLTGNLTGKGKLSQPENQYIAKVKTERDGGWPQCKNADKITLCESAEQQNRTE